MNAEIEQLFHTLVALPKLARTQYLAEHEG
jgi:hypothetical protein